MQTLIKAFALYYYNYFLKFGIINRQHVRVPNGPDDQWTCEVAILMVAPAVALFSMLNTHINKRLMYICLFMPQISCLFRQNDQINVDPYSNSMFIHY